MSKPYERSVQEQYIADAARIRDLEGRIARLEEVNAKLVVALEKALGSIDALMADSQGVAGLHLNGDVAPWDELVTGGRFESWLTDLDEGRAALAAAKEQQPLPSSE